MKWINYLKKKTELTQEQVENLENSSILIIEKWSTIN